jgi:protein associated with RNAse G/E
MNVRVRGIYATALTELLRDDHDVVQASPPIQRRFDDAFPERNHAVALWTTDDRLGVGAAGDPDAVGAAADALGGVARDALVHPDPAPRGAVFDAVVTDTLGGGAVLDLGEREGYLPYDAVEGTSTSAREDAVADQVEDGDALRVQVTDPAPPWGDDRPELAADLRAPAGLATLREDVDGTVVDGRRGADARELAGLTDLVDADVPDGWGVEWGRGATHVEMTALRGALADAVDRAEALGALDDAVEPTRRLAAPLGTTWVRFNRESRFALDGRRRAVTATMPGHHRVKAGSRSASGAVDFVEAVCDDMDGDDPLPFDAVVGQYGPEEGDRVAIQHGKPDGRTFTLGRGRVSTLSVEDHEVTVRREMSSSGTYDGLGTPRERGDVAITRLREGRWWYPTAYRGEDGTRKGTYVNVCTPIELFPDAATYVDLHVDVMDFPDGGVEIVDADELDAAVAAGHLSEALAEKAMAVAEMLADAL